MKHQLKMAVVENSELIELKAGNDIKPLEAYSCQLHLDSNHASLDKMFKSLTDDIR